MKTMGPKELGIIFLLCVRNTGYKMFHLMCAVCLMLMFKCHEKLMILQLVLII